MYGSAPVPARRDERIDIIFSWVYRIVGELLDGLRIAALPASDRPGSVRSLEPIRPAV